MYQSRLGGTQWPRRETQKAKVPVQYSGWIALVVHYLNDRIGSFSLYRTSQCHREIQITFYVNLTCTSEKAASAGNRTRIYCLEGNNANLYTTDAVA